MRTAIVMASMGYLELDLGLEIPFAVVAVLIILAIVSDVTHITK